MKKVMLFMLLILCVPMAFGYVATADWSRPYWQPYNNIGSENPELLRATTYTNIENKSMTFCTIPYLNDKDSYIYTYEEAETNYSHYSYIVLSSNGVAQIGSDCSVLDYYSESGIITSDLAIIKGGRVDGVYRSPYFAYTYNNTDDSVYMRVLKFDDDTSEFISYKNILINDSQKPQQTYRGIAGGCIEATSTYCEDDGTAFGVVFSDSSTGYDDAYFVGGFNDWTPLTKRVFTSNKLYDSPFSNTIFFDDWGDSGINKFIWLISYNTNNHFNMKLTTFRVTTGSSVISITTTSLANIIIGHNTLVDYSNYNEFDAYVTPCQVGLRDSDPEICYSINVQLALGNERIGEGIINGDFNGFINSTYIDSTNNEFPMPVFTYDINADNRLEACIVELLNDTYSTEIHCLDENGALKGTFNTTIDLIRENPYNILLLRDMDNNTGTLELLLSTGERQALTLNGTAKALSNWHNLPDMDDAEIKAGDVNNDGIYELMIRSSDYGRIYSVDDTPFTFEAISDFGTGATTTTTTTNQYTTDINTGQDLIDRITSPSTRNLILALVIIIGLMMTVAAISKNAIVIVMAGIIGAIIGVVIGVLSFAVLILIIVSMVVLLLLFVTVFNKSEGS